MDVSNGYEASQELLTTREVIEAFPAAGLTAPALRRWAREKKIAYVRMPSGRLKFRRQDIEQLLSPVQPVGSETEEVEDPRANDVPLFRVR